MVNELILIGLMIIPSFMIGFIIGFAINQKLVDKIQKELIKTESYLENEILQ